MGTFIWIIVGVALGLASPFMVLQFRRHRDLARAGAAGRIRSSETVRPGNPFAAVSIRPCADSPCAAVVQMQVQNRRFLAVRAPKLPVPGCDRKQCGCHYIRHADRRAPGDRRDHFVSHGERTQAMREDRRRADRRKPQ